MKQIYDVGEMPELGVVPEKMHAWVVRPESHGNPISSFKEEIVDTPEIGDNEVLILVMAAGVNFNGIWAALGKPVSPMLFHKEEFHIAGSDASGIIWRIGSALLQDKTFIFKVGDEVVVHCSQYCGKCPNCNGGNPMLCAYQKIWGYETSYGSFAQFARVQPTQLLAKPKDMPWSEAGAYMLTAATAWQMLFGFYPNVVKPGKNVLVFGGAGGVGAFIIQLTKLAGGNVVAVVSSEERGKWCEALGANGYVNRKDFDCWGRLPEINTQEYKDYLKKVRKFGKAVWQILGDNVNPDIVVDFIGEKTFPVSTYIVDKGGMVVTCGASSGFMINFDASYLWMRQKRIQGSHFCTLKEMEQLQKMITEKRICSSLSKVFEWNELPRAHEDMYNGGESVGNIAVLIQAKAATSK